MAKTAKGNGRDSNAQYLGVKVFGGQKVRSGNIIVRQKGTKFMPGNNVGLAKNYNIFATIDGIVKFERFNREKQKVSVYPA